MSNENVYPRWRIFESDATIRRPVRLHYMRDESVSAGFIEQNPAEPIEGDLGGFYARTNQEPHIDTHVFTLGEAMTLVEWAYHEHTKEQP